MAISGKGINMVLLNENINYKDEYQKEVAFSKKCMQEIHNLKNENSCLKAETETLRAELQEQNQTVSVTAIGNVVDALMKALSGHGMAVTIKHDSEY